jgi:hypothetical protein
MNRTHTMAKVLLIHVSIILTQVSVPIEDGSQQSVTFTRALKGLALTCPIMPLANQHFRAHFNPYKLSVQTTKTFINNKGRHCQP